MTPDIGIKVLMQPLAQESQATVGRPEIGWWDEVSGTWTRQAEAMVLTANPQLGNYWLTPGGVLARITNVGDDVQ